MSDFDDFDLDEMEFSEDDCLDDFAEDNIPSEEDEISSNMHDDDIFGITAEEFIFDGMILGQAYEDGLDEQGQRKKKKPE